MKKRVKNLYKTNRERNIRVKLKSKQQQRIIIMGKLISINKIIEKEDKYLHTQ
jgi:hypothetical protein